MSTTAVPVLIVTGPMGAGKSTVASAASDLLRGAGVPHALVDLDALTYCYPAAPDDPYRQQLALRNLAAVWRNYVAAGARRLIVDRVVEARAELDGYRQAIPNAEITLVRLRADPDVLVERVLRRGADRDMAWATLRARQLAAEMDASPIEDLLVEIGDRTPPELAAEILRRIGWLRAAG